MSKFIEIVDIYNNYIVLNTSEILQLTFPKEEFIWRVDKTKEQKVVSRVIDRNYQCLTRIGVNEYNRVTKILLENNYRLTKDTYKEIDEKLSNFRDK